MNEQEQKLSDGISELRKFLDSRREPNYCLACCIGPIIVVVFTVILGLFNPAEDTGMNMWSLIVVIAVIFSFGFFLKARDDIKKYEKEFNTLVYKTGFTIVKSKSGRRFAAPISDDLKACWNKLAYPLHSPIIFCRSCQKYIEPGDLVGLCSSCNRTCHLECLGDEPVCGFCMREQEPNVHVVIAIDEEDLDVPFVIEEQMLEEHYVPGASAIEFPHIEFWDNIPLDEDYFRGRQ